MSAGIESEIKLRLPSADVGLEALRRLGARELRPRGFEDNVLFDDVRASLQGAGCVLRLRRDPAGALLTHKGPAPGEPGVKTRRETELGVADPDAMHAVLEALGFRPVFRYQKFRSTFEHAGVEIVLDETPIGAFLEIEGPPEGIHTIARALGYSREDYVAGSYVELFFEGGGSGDMVFG